MYSEKETQGPDGFRADEQDGKPNEGDAEDLREANQNIRKAQGDDSTAEPFDGRRGNRPRFDRDR